MVIDGVCSSCDGRSRSARSAPARANSEFARRRRRGFGEFLTGDEIMRRTSTYLANALFGIGGLRIIGTNQIGQPLIAGRSNCTPAVFLDRFRLPEGINGLDRWVRSAEIGGIEVYADGVKAPPRYGSVPALNEAFFSETGAVILVPRAGAAGAGGCGVILVWTRQAIWQPLQCHVLSEGRQGTERSTPTSALSPSCEPPYGGPLQGVRFKGSESLNRFHSRGHHSRGQSP